MQRSLLEKNSTTFIRFNEAISILRKIENKHEDSFSEMISARKPFGIETNVPISMIRRDGYVSVFAYPQNGYVAKERITSHNEWINQIKVCISYAYGERGEFPYQVIGKPFIAPSGSCCTETYLVVCTCPNIEYAKNVLSYMGTKLFRFLVLLKKNTQHATKNVYELVPKQEFSKPWTDEELYAKYEITEDEIAFIDSMIRPMDLSGGEDNA